MNRFLIGFVVSLGMLLLHGYSQLYRHTTAQECPCYASVKEAGKPEVVGCSAQPSDMRPVSWGITLEKHRFDLTEIEEKEEDENDKEKGQLAERKKSGRAKHFAAAFGTTVTGDLFRHAGKSVGSGLRFCYIRSNPWYILFRVIRI
jgi:hypothetical protein